MRRFQLGSKGVEVLFSLIMTFVFAWISISPPRALHSVINRLEDLIYDVRLNSWLPAKPVAKNPIVIVDIDEKSIREIGRWPWSREKLTQLVQKMYAQGATVIAFDMLFSEPESLQDCKPGTVNQDLLFKNILEQGRDKVILGSFLSNEHEVSIGQLPKPSVELIPLHLTDLAIPRMQSYISNIPLFENAVSSGGVLSIIPDGDGILRRYSLLQRYGDNLYPSLALAAVQLYLLEKNISISVDTIGKEKVIGSIKLGNTVISTDQDGRVFVPYIGPARSFPYYSATDVMNDRLPEDTLQNTIVFVGTSAVGLGDVRATPVGSVYPGVEVHANVAEGLFLNRFSYIPSWEPGAELVLILVLGVFLTLLFAYVGPVWIGVSTTLVLVSLYFGMSWLWQKTYIILPLVIPTVLVIFLAVFNIAYRFFLESRRRTELKHAFEQYVPVGRVDEILKDPEAADAFEGERKTMSVLFMDIRNFTTISEKLNIVELKKLLNFFLTEMTTVIFKHGGTVDKYVGDMIMAFWGAPLPDPDHARHALRAGVDMLATTQKIEAKLIEMGLPSVRVGVGINTGLMDVGDMGSTYRRAYTVLGDAVNLASRLESLTKYYGVGMLVGENTISYKTEFEFRLIDKVKVKGRHETVKVYEPVTEDMRPTLETYQTALNHYFARKWSEAKQLFSQLSEQSPDIKLFQLYLTRVIEFEKSPPPENWDGSWEHSEK
ncbi:MAG: adenylate/guanylate cyclase domain-containing protein [Gammaproteobacteria bacterium]|nr:adenylate/guanylate cyclase domain-containing protein [Gammaproteobacteria bacterium]